MQFSACQSLQRKLLSLAKLNNLQKVQQNLQQQQQQNDSELLPKKQKTIPKNNSLIISYIQIQKMPLKIAKIIEQNLQNIIDLSITNCDLRTFQNFPKLKMLKNVNVSRNSLRGSFQFLVKNRAIRYIDVSHNIIGDVKRLQPLKCLKDISIYAKNNPFQTIKKQGSAKNNYLQQIKAYGIKYLQSPINRKKQVKIQQFLPKKKTDVSDIQTRKQKLLLQLIKREKKKLSPMEKMSLIEQSLLLRDKSSVKDSQSQFISNRSPLLRQASQSRSNQQNGVILRIESNANSIPQPREQLDAPLNFQIDDVFIQQNQQQDDQDEGEQPNEQNFQFFSTLQRQQRQIIRRSGTLSALRRVMNSQRQQSQQLQEDFEALSSDSDLSQQQEEDPL